MNSFSRFVFVFVASVFLCSVVVGQKQPLTAVAVADSGTFDGKLYSNSILGFTMLVPGGWTVFTNNQNAATLVAGRATTKTIASGLTQKELADIERSISNTQILFQASSLTKAGNISTAVLSSGVERMQTPLTKEKYIEANKKLVLLNSSVKVTRDIYTTKLGNVAFAGFDIEGTANSKAYRQSYLATIRKGTALFFVTTLWDNKNDLVLDAGFQTLKFGQ